jgi:prepilin-type processing-associated H-X9-DG protein
MYASENNGKFPIQTAVTNGGTMDFLERDQTFPHYQKLSVYLLNTGVLVCPADKNRRAPDSYKNLTDTNISYFLNADVSTNNPTASIMLGDRNLEANGQPIGHGTYTLATKMNLGWTRELHPNGGALGFADGHAEFCRGADLDSAFQRQGLASIRLSVP